MEEETIEELEDRIASQTDRPFEMQDESIEQLDRQIRQLERSNECLEMTKLRLLKNIMHLDRVRALDQMIDRELARKHKEELAKHRRLQREYRKRVLKLRQLMRELERRKGVKQGRSHMKLNSSTPRAKKLGHPKCCSISK